MDELTPPRPPATLPGGFGPSIPTDPPQRAPVSVPAGNGIAWWCEGWRLFRTAPGVWIGITVLFVVITIMLHLIPLLGSIATTLLGPVLAGGVMSGCRAIDRGGQLTIAHMFAGFSERLMPLITVGILYLVGSLVIVAVSVGVIVAVVGMSSLAVLGALFSDDPMQAGMTVLTTFGIGATFAVLVGLLLAIPLTMAYWFAPVLVMLRNEEPYAAMKTSFNASLINVMSMLVYSLLGLVFAIVATIPLLLGWLVLGPVFAASVYASYKDIFGETA